MMRESELREGEREGRSDDVVRFVEAADGLKGVPAREDGQLEHSSADTRDDIDSRELIRSWKKRARCSSRSTREGRDRFDLARGVVR